MKKVKSFFNMKKWVLGALACVALVLLMPGEAKAVEYDPNLNFSNVYTDSGVLDTDKYYWNYSDSVNVDDMNTWHKLTLQNFTITAKDGRGAIKLPDCTIIELIGNNIIDYDYGSTGGIYALGALKITGNGKLTIEVENVCGIYATRDVTIDGVTIEIKDTGVHGNSKIYSDSGNISITNSNVTINGKSNDGLGNGNGLQTDGSGEIIINNSEVYIEIIDYGVNNHCLKPGGQPGDTKLTIESAANLKVTYVNNGETKTIYRTITDSDKDELCDSGTKKVTITCKDSTNPGSPSDKKNESSPFHKFETGSIKEAKASGTIDATGGWKSFDRGTLNELSKLGKDISVTYDFNGHTYCVVVPKGFDPQNLVNEEGYCGFLYLAKVYGAVMIK